MVTANDKGRLMQSRLFIDGNWCAAQGGGKLDLVNPANERVFHQCAAGGAEDIDKAVAAAKTAMAGPWARTTGKDRAKFLRAIASAIEERKQALAEIEVKDNGKPLPEALWDTGDAAYCFNLYATYAEDLDARQGEVIAVPDARFESRVRYMPSGDVPARVILIDAESHGPSTPLPLAGRGWGWGRSRRVY
jgi:betaine-aldehyde dehydrogenase